MGIALYGIASNRLRSRKLEEWYQENSTAIDFGNFVKEVKPSMWNYWQSGKWSHDVVVRDSMH